MELMFESYSNSILLDEKSKFAPHLASAMLAFSPMGATTAHAKTNDGPSITQNAQFANKNLPRGIRNNNPGNIDKTNVKWEGEVGDDGRFIQFASIEWGIRAMGRILKTYDEKYGRNTIEKIVYRWAPPNENDTEEYIKTVSDISGIPRDKVIIQGTTSQIKLIHAMIIVENGKRGKVDKRTIGRGLSLMNQTYKGE